MDHSDHSGHMDHSDHSGHMDHSEHMDQPEKLAMDVINTTMKAVMDAMSGDHSGHMDHSGHADHSAHMDHSTKMDHSSHSMGHDTHCGMDGMSMSMSFHFGVDEVILFDFWTISTVGGLIGSMIGIFILAMLYEGLKYWREHLFRKAIASMQYCNSEAKGPNETEGAANKSSHYMEQIINPPTMTMLSPDHLIQTLLHIVQMVVSYLLMLIFMTYNVWLCIATVLGAALGYFLFGWRKSVVVDITEHCH